MRYLVVILWIPTVHLMDPHPAEVMLMVMKLVGEIFGIVAGTLGIFLTRTNNDERMKCLWKAFIALVGRFFLPRISTVESPPSNHHSVRSHNNMLFCWILDCFGMVISIK